MVDRQTDSPETEEALGGLSAGAGQVTLKIPRELYNRLRVIIRETGFRSVTEFAVYVLRDLASTHALQTSTREQQGVRAGAAAAPAETESLTADEIEAIRRRLRALGYL